MGAPFSWVPKGTIEPRGMPTPPKKKIDSRADIPYDAEGLTSEAEGRGGDVRLTRTASLLPRLDLSTVREIQSPMRSRCARIRPCPPSMAQWYARYSSSMTCRSDG